MIRLSTTVLFVVMLAAAGFMNLRAQPIGTAVADSVGTIGEDFYRNTYYAIGANLGFFSGTGLSGRFSFPGGFTIQPTFFIASIGEYVHYNFGMEAQYAFARSRSGRLYGLAGFGYYVSESDKPEKPGNRIAEPFHIGAGVGYEYFTNPNFVIAISGAFTALIGGEKTKVYPLPELGFFYYFR